MERPMELSRPRCARGRALLGPLGMAVVTVAAAVVVATVDPNQPGHYPTCPSFLVTGLFCPGCGTLRAANALLNGNLVGALRMNVLAVLAIPVVFASWVAWLRRAATGRPRSWLAPWWVPAGTLALLVVFTVARNTPAFAPWLAP